MDLLKEQNENDKQFFPNVIKEQKEIEREERERDGESFFKLGAAMFSNNIGNYIKVSYCKMFCSDQSLKSVLEMGVLYIAVKIVEKQL